MKKIFTLIALLLVTAAGFGQAITTYTGSGGNSTAVTANNANVTVSILQKAGPFGSNTACGSGGMSGITSSVTSYSPTGPHVFYQVFPKTGFQINVTGISAITRESGTGPTTAFIAYSLDGGTTWVADIAHPQARGASCGNPENSFSWGGGALPTAISSTTTGILVAVYPYGGASTGTFQINSLVVNGTVTASSTTVSPITGTTTICLGTTSQLSDATASGTWTSSNTAVATVSATGLVTSVTTGTSTITYKVGSLSATALVTVAANPTVAAITGPSIAVCQGSTLALSDATASGTWSSSDVTKATISSTGTVTGVAPGSSIVKYLVVNAAACRDSAFYPVVINDTPSFSIVASGPTTFCNGSSVTLTATPNAAPTTNNAVQLTGTATNITTSPYISAPVLPTFSDNFTFECWVNPTTTIALPAASTSGAPGTGSTSHYVIFPTWGGIASNTTGAINIGVGAGISVGTNGVAVYEHGAAYLPSLLTWTGTVSGWTHIAVVYTNKQPTLYVNGVLKATGLTSTAAHVYPSIGQFSGNCCSLYGGIGGGIYGGTFPGQIDEFSIWNVALPAATILANYNKAITTPAANLFAYYKFDEGTGTTVADASGNGNTATFHNNVTGNPAWITTGAPITTTGAPTGPDNNTYLWSPGGATTADTTVSTAGTYTVTATNPSGCKATASKSVSITPDASVSLSSATGTDGQTLCVNTPITTTTYAVGGSGNNGSVSGLPTGVNWFYAAGIIVISGTPTVAGTYTYTVTATGTCAPATITGTITVTPNATISLSSAVGSDDQSVCINTPLTTITYTIGGSGNNASITTGTLPAGVTSSYAANVFTISGTPTVAGTYPYTITVTGTCAPTTITGVINVNADATISFTSATGTDAQIGCSGSAITNITYLVGGTGTGAVATGLPTGVTGSNGAGGVFTISGTPTVTGTFTYTVTTTGSPCVNPSLTGTLTINTTPVVAAITGPVTVCAASTITLSDDTTGGVWSSSNTAIATINNNGVVTGVTPGTATISYAVTNNCATTTVTYNITVVGKPAVSPVTGSTDVCVGTNTAVLNDATPAGVWTSSNNAIATIDNSGKITAVAPGSVMIAYTVTGSCFDSTAVYTFTVDPKPSLTVSADTIICTNGQATLRAMTDAGSTVQWSGAGSNVNPFVVSPSSNTTYQVTATSNKGCTNNASVNVTVEDFTVSVTADPNPVVIGKQFTLTTTASVTPYQVVSWQPVNLFSNQTATTQTVTGDSTRVYVVTAKTNEGCVDTDSVLVRTLTKEYDLYIPNYLSPNNDGKNDVVYVRSSYIKTMEWRIYNQYGALIFESNDQNKGWGGSYKGQQQPVGVYVYVLKITQLDGTEINKKGSITIIR